MREKKQTGEQCWGRLARLMSAFRQIMKGMRKRSRERKCLFDAFDVRKMSAMLSKRWMSDTCEILLEDWEACVAQKEEGRRRTERMERHKACVVKITCGGSRRGSGNEQCNLWCAACGGQYNWKKPNRVLVTLNIAGPSEAAVFWAHAPPQGACQNLVCALKQFAKREARTTSWTRSSIFRRSRAD